MTEPTLPRALPAPLPAIHPVPEYAVEGERAARYADVKAVLQVPWMGVVTMAFAHYPQFFGALWDGLRPVCASEGFVGACRELRAFVEAGAADLGAPDRRAWLAEAGFGACEIDDIRATIEVFSHGNYPYLLIASSARRLLTGQAIGSDGAVAPFEGRHAPDVAAPFVLMERHHADPPLRAVYDDIMATLGLPFVNTDYRALGRWPRYFARAWADLKPVIDDDRHAALVEATYARALAATETLAGARAIKPDAVRDAAAQDAPLEQIGAVVQLFHALLPQLVVNVAFFRAQLRG